MLVFHHFSFDETWWHFQKSAHIPLILPLEIFCGVHQSTVELKQWNPPEWASTPNTLSKQPYIKISFKFLSLLQFTDWIEVWDNLNRVYLKDTKDKHMIIAMHSSASYKEKKQNSGCFLKLVDTQFTSHLKNWSCARSVFHLNPPINEWRPTGTQGGSCILRSLKKVLVEEKFWWIVSSNQ